MNENVPVFELDDTEITLKENAIAIETDSQITVIRYSAITSIVTKPLDVIELEKDEDMITIGLEEEAFVLLFFSKTIQNKETGFAFAKAVDERVRMASQLIQEEQ